jgi:hypothetical protein
LRGFWQNKPDFGAAAATAQPVRRSPKGERGKLNASKGCSYRGTVSRSAAKRLRQAWAAVAAIAKMRAAVRPGSKREGGVWQNKPDHLSARSKADPVGRCPTRWIPGSRAELVIGPAEGRTRWPAPRNDRTEPLSERLRQRFRPLHSRPIGRTIDARPIWPGRTRDRRHWAMHRRPPPVPSARTTPAHAAPPAEPAPIPAGAAPSAIVPAVTVASPIELHRLHGSKLIGCRPQVAWVHHGGIRAHAGHCADDGERRGQCHAEFTHCMFPSRVSGWAGCDRQHRWSRSLRRQTHNQPAVVRLHHALLRSSSVARAGRSGIAVVAAEPWPSGYGASP